MKGKYMALYILGVMAFCLALCGGSFHLTLPVPIVIGHVMQLVGIQAELNSRLEIHGRIGDCQIPFRILRVPERLCGRFIPRLCLPS